MGLARLVACALAAHVRDTDTKIDALDHEILRWHRNSADSQRLASIPGIDPLIAIAIAATMGDPSRFKTGRDFAAWLGLVPSQNSTGGKTVLGPITKAGDRYLRSLLVVGATSSLWRRRAEKGTWLAALIARGKFLLLWPTRWHGSLGPSAPRVAPTKNRHQPPPEKREEPIKIMGSGASRPRRGVEQCSTSLLSYCRVLSSDRLRRFSSAAVRAVPSSKAIS
ncbi:Transposase IS116/IS110/IS902 family protein [Insolitispirillum peregrinum]|uniref:Transposase IS116/IS110/IS902 family protein n=2 Tax=Insolitispirillum peregrinum TaxID=80876 RepID=A0A1N7JCM0_9PROT|nr:Transposase IS116/IS110/IS902 family protein [Insolitispirillum peregrinum]